MGGEELVISRSSFINERKGGHDEERKGEKKRN